MYLKRKEYKTRIYNRYIKLVLKNESGEILRIKFHILRHGRFNSHILIRDQPRVYSSDCEKQSD